ncbi:MAG: iron-sulfur cluster-binding protein [Candidatus Dadabacteria bacterium]
METRRLRFEIDSASALKNQNLQKALRNATDRFRAIRERATGEIKDWEDLRRRAREIKKNTIEHIDQYLEILEESIKKAGGTIHWARDGNEACSIILDIARKNKVKSVVKSKSMATEEIELNQALEGAGIRVVETDLGEYIVQIAKERPSHILAPAIHKTKEDIARLFTERLNTQPNLEPEQITKVAREKLRGEFLSADMGISGVNFAVAETGTIVIIENEGNARLSTTIPRIHIALMGIEKVTPKFEDISTFLNVLFRSASGQKISAYVSFITGPKRKSDADGPEEFHLVIMDNGRSEILAHEETRETLYCIRCGACLNICPVYRKVGGHSYGWIYSGPIGAILTPQLLGIDKAPDLPFASSLCGACKDVCPVKIDIPRVLLELRKRVKDSKEGRKNTGFGERIAVRLWRFSMEHKIIYSLVSSLSYIVQKPWLKNGRLRSLPLPFSRWTNHRDFPAVSKTPFRRMWREIKDT